MNRKYNHISNLINTSGLNTPIKRQDHDVEKSRPDPLYPAIKYILKIKAQIVKSVRMQKSTTLMLIKRKLK